MDKIDQFIHGNCINGIGRMEFSPESATELISISEIFPYYRRSIPLSNFLIRTLNHNLVIQFSGTTLIVSY
jgi:hypothetical protein